MQIVDVSALEQEGLEPALIDAYRQAVDESWTETAAELRAFGSRPFMFLQLQNPALDRETVTVSIGIGARHGATSAKSPSELKRALMQYLRDHFA